jgi:molybdopterin converting factor small subunit
VSPDTTQITLRLFGALRDAVGEKEVALPFSEGTVEETLHRFIEGRGQAARRFIFDGEGNLWRSLLLLLNDEPIEDAKTTAVKAGDVISLLLPVAGG